MGVTICVSLGGSRLEVGLLSDQPSSPRYVGSGSVDWRRELIGSAASARALCDVVASLTATLIENLTDAMSENLSLGVAFPGPQANGVWFSNNLTDDFRGGVPLERLLKVALQERCNLMCPRLVILLDAQADAGGEVYHPDGALRESGPMESACVLNIATGIAAGFVDAGCQWGVLHTTSEFKAATNGCFDNGGGQLGRHLYVSCDGEWTYHYRPFGQTASEVSGIRMTDYLSGPALTARLALELVRRGERVGDGWREFSWVESQARRLCEHKEDDLQPDSALGELGALIRANCEPVSRLVLAWADRSLGDSSTPCSLRQALHDFRETVACDFGRALAVLQSERGWERFGRRIVMTGGVGQNLFARSGQSFMSRIESFLHPDTVLVRSRLVGGAERAAWFFHRGVFN